MLSLILLFFIFLGLVGLLALYAEWLRKPSSPSPKTPGDLAKVAAWVEREKCSLPTTEQVIGVFNRVARRRHVQPEDGVSEGRESGLLMPVDT